MRRLFWPALGAAALGAYALYEPRRFRLSIRELPVSEPCPPLSILHVSDTHLSARSKALRRWLDRLVDDLPETPDIVAATGDLIQDESGIDEVIDSFARLEARLGRFYVLGSHDYFASEFQSYFRYVTGRRSMIRARRLPTDRLETGLQNKGWISLGNRTEMLATQAGGVRVAGVDDPYLGWDRTDHIERRRDEVLAVGLVHSPDVVSEWVLNSFDVVLGGHTHGGQVRLPGIGAIVTNCTLPTGLAGGAHRIGDSWLHVSPGLGAGRFSPIRFNCRPEATLLRLRPA
ncbi:MAG: metallophosphoesterase [Actinomycetota bacterium]